MDAENFIQELGGAAKVARALGVPLTTVDSWKRRNKIPAWRIARLAELAIGAGKALPDTTGLQP
jgi:hypothetical protein